ncbi:ATP-binding protein [Halomonas sp. LY9]
MARSDIVEWQVKRQPLDPSTLLGNAIDQASTLGRLRNIVVSSGPIHSTTVLGDPQRLQQIVAILLDNAVQYSHAGGVVNVSAEVANKQGKAVWELCVRDHGIGLMDSEAPRLFERGYRGMQARHHRPDGQGVGLAIAMLLTRLHGGQLSLETVHEGGCEARLQLPVHAAAGHLPLKDD